MDAHVRKPKLFVYVGHTGKNLLRQISARRVRFYSADHKGGGHPQVALFQSSMNLDFVPRAAEFPDEVWVAPRRGFGKVVFDASLEGRPHLDANSAALHGFLDKVGVSPAAAVYVTQNREYETDYKAWCARMGLSQRMKIVYYDYWIRRFFRDHEETGEAVFAQRLDAFHARRRTRPGRFLSLNGTLRPTKILFLLSLLRDGLWDSGFVSFGGFDRTLRTTNRSIPKLQKHIDALPGFAELHRELAPLIPTLDALGPIILGRFAGGGDRTMTEDEALPEYDASWFSVVTESEMLEQPCRITEKPMKPLVNFHPFMMLGNPGALKMIRSLGFQTFPEMFDESYDEVLSARRRFDMVYAGLQRLCRMDEADLARLDAAVSEKLVFNAEWGLTRLPGIYREEIDEALVNDIMAPA